MRADDGEGDGPGDNAPEDGASEQPEPRHKKKNAFQYTYLGTGQITDEMDLQ